MISNGHQTALEAITYAKSALTRGDRSEARRWANLAVQLEPGTEEGWLVLAASSDPKDAIDYLQQALIINPNSSRALKGLEWAHDLLEQNQHETGDAHKPTTDSQLHSWQLESEMSSESSQVSGLQNATPGAGNLSQQIEDHSIPTLKRSEISTRRVTIWPWLLGILLLCIGAAGFYYLPALIQSPATKSSSVIEDGAYVKPTLTMTPTLTFTPTLTNTATPTETPTPTATNTPLPTDTPLLTATFPPTNTPFPPVVYVQEDYVYDPGEIPNVRKKERWIDVDLSSQTVYAYEGQKTVNSFLVSTGTSAHPTVTGRYHIYVKYRYDDMNGPGYSLPDVPYVMYFYEGYSLHGTYWHHNFGTPMSHGCVNMLTADAAWLYNWVDVGTLVNVHY